MHRNRPHLLFALFALLGAAATQGLIAADDEKMDKGKAKEADKPKAKEKEEEKDESWSSLLTVSNHAGFKEFSVDKDGKVKFSWETTPDGQVPNFRVTVAKHNARTGSFQTFATIATTHGKSKDSATMNLGAGKYRLYIATKMMKYTLTVEGKGK